MHNNSNINLNLISFIELQNKMAKDKQLYYPNKMIVCNLMKDSKKIEKEIKRLADFKIIY